MSVSEAVQGASVAVIMAAHRANGDKEAIDNERELKESNEPSCLRQWQWQWRSSTGGDAAMIVWQSPAIEHSIAAVIVVNERDTTTTTTSPVTSCTPLRQNLEKSSFQSLKTSLLNDHSVIGSRLLPTTYLLLLLLLLQLLPVKVLLLLSNVVPSV